VEILQVGVAETLQSHDFRQALFEEGVIPYFPKWFGGHVVLILCDGNTPHSRANVLCVRTFVQAGFPG
jgi:hypothetical protein